ncbi:G-protein alpha subunit [Mycena crocata]|nr:G-protein alpha subunit [Mycena crocata]
MTRISNFREPLQDDIDTTELLNWKELRPSEPTESANAGVKKASILILGQADSGKSSLLRNFRLAFTPRQFESERLLWKTVIQLNLIHSARKILNVLEQEEQESDSPESRNSARNHRRIVQALSALETSSRYSMGGDIRSGFRMTVCPGTNPTQVDQFLRTYQRDIIVLSSLWKDSGVRRALDSRKARPQDDPGFFLDDAPRVTADNYIPTNRDIMRAKIRTMGVEEQRFVADSGPTLGTEFFIVEVGQTKRKTAVWNFMHDQVQVIMFLAPLVFWQRLDDNPEVNRVQDSLELWKETVSSQLLARITLILLFNKKDLLQAHIAEGGQMKRYVPSFGDRRNDVPTITKYFRDHFSQCSRKFSPFRRPFICYETEIIDTKSTARVLGNVHDEIIRMNVKDVEFV